MQTPEQRGTSWRGYAGEPATRPDAVISSLHLNPSPRSFDPRNGLVKFAERDQDARRQGRGQEVSGSDEVRRRRGDQARQDRGPDRMRP